MATPLLSTPPPAALRPDLQAIADLVQSGTRVLDLGCGDGALLDYLLRRKGVNGRGIELDENNILTCVRRGLSVRQGNLQEGLADYPSASFDSVILSQTVQFLDDPVMIINEMLRVGQQAIISFPNWGHWRCRLSLLLRGYIPEAPDYPERWYTAPRWQALTVADFTRLCADNDINIRATVFLSGERRGTFWPNLMAQTAIFALGTNP